MTQVKTVLDIALENKAAETKQTFLNDWTPEQFKAIEKAIRLHFANKEIKTLHGDYVPYYRGFNALDEIMGFAYTSSSLCAGYWICDTDVYSPKYPGYHYIGFALNNENKAFAILWDKDENEILQPL